MLITQLVLGNKYKTTGRQLIKIITTEIESKELIPSGTIITPLRVNEKSVRVRFNFKDKDRANYNARLPFNQNQGDFEIKEM